MARAATGSVIVQTLVDGTRAYQLRFRAAGRREHETLHERRACACGCGGGCTERTAALELENILARVRAGVWRRREVVTTPDRKSMPTFHEYASAWLQSKIAGVLGDRPIDTNTEADYRWRLARHLLPFFGGYRLDEIDADLCLGFKAHKLREAADLRSAMAAGAILREPNGRRQQPLGPSSIKKLIDCLAAVLDEAIEDDYVDLNPARGRRMRIKVPKPVRTFLEMDELVAITDAAAEQDARTAPPRGASGTRGLYGRGCRRAVAARHAAERHRERTWQVEGDRELSPAAARRRRPGDVRWSPRNRGDARRLWRTSKRAVRPPDRGSTPARGRGR